MRLTLRVAILTVGGAAVVWRGSVAAHYLAQWLALRTSDPSAAELYEVSFKLELGIVLAVVLVSAAGIWLLGDPRLNSGNSGSATR
jgi:hypothetical protein